jgi:protein ImuA
MRIALAPGDSPPQSANGFWPTGIASLDTVLAGGLAYGCVHEIYAAEGSDAASAAGFATLVAKGMSVGMGGGRCRPTALWLRERGRLRTAGILQAEGWAQLGGMPGHGLIGVVPDTLSLLRAAVDALRCAALGAVILEGWGRMRELDLTASRRLVLAAERSGVPLLLLRIDAEPAPSAARTRWRLASAPSRALPGKAPGSPAFDLTLLRQKSGPSGRDWLLEWDREQCKFREASLPGAVVSVSSGRPAAERTRAERAARIIRAA